MDKMLRRDFGAERLRYLASQSGVRPRFRLVKLSPGETPVGEITEDIIGGSGSYSEKRENGARRTLSLSVYDKERKYTARELSASFWWGRKFRFDIGMEYRGDVYWTPKGVLTPTSVSGEGTDTVSLNFADKYAFFDGTVSGTIEMTYKIHRDESIYDILQNTALTDCGTGYPYDPQKILMDEDLKLLYSYYTQTLEAGGSYSEFMETTREMANANMFYDDTGHLRFNNGLSGLSRVYEALAAELSTEGGGCLSISVSKDWSSVYNQVRVVGAQVDGDLLTCAMTNNNPYSPLRAGLNPIKCKTITDNNIISQKYVCDRARYEMGEIVLHQKNYEMSTVLLPYLGADMCIGVTDRKLGLENERLIVTSVSLSIASNPYMQIGAANTKNIALADEWEYTTSLEQAGAQEADNGRG